jgi:hypothetical protein
MRLDEFSTSSEQFSKDILYLYAWATYKRGDIPTQGEYEYINKRVTAKFPTAELVEVRRRLRPDVLGEKSTKVTWEFKWVVYKQKEGETK